MSDTLDSAAADGAYTVTVINTPDLIELAEQGNRIGYNRQLDPAQLRAQLDPEGTHILRFSMLHEHIAGELSEPHARCIWMCKLRDRPADAEQAMEVTVDIELRAFMGLNKLRRIVGGPNDGGYELIRPNGDTELMPGAGESA